MKTYRILLVDDHAVVRQGLKGILEDELGDVEFGEAENTGQALALAFGSEWDIVILDISIPGRSGLDALKEIKQQCPKLPVLVLSIHSEEQYATRVLRGGAAGYMTKECAPSELVSAVKKAIDGGKYISPSLAEKLANDLERKNCDTPHEQLSDREYEVLISLASGKTVSEIAEGLSLSVKSISTYRARVLEKMNMKNNAELMQYAMKKDLVA